MVYVYLMYTKIILGEAIYFDFMLKFLLEHYKTFYFRHGSEIEI